MKKILTLLAVFATLFVASTVNAGEKKATRIMLIGKDKDHARAAHEYMADCEILAKCLRQTPGVEVVIVKNWPKSSKEFEGISAVVLNTRLGGNVAFDPLHKADFEHLMKSGVGVTAIHWGTGADQKFGQDWLNTMGGWFNTDFSKYLVKTCTLQQADPTHPISWGWKEYQLRDEYYIQLKYLEGAKPVLKVAFDGKEHTVAWVYDRPGSKNGRSFGCVLGHFHDNYAEAGFRKLLVNGILWTAHVTVPQNGAPVQIVPTDLDLPPETKKK